MEIDYGKRAPRISKRKHFEIKLKLVYNWLTREDDSRVQMGANVLILFRADNVKHK